ncbi:zinc-ribbon domain-containing protein, partial [Oscillochloris sp. ZM17-4]|uniref:zinc-ribbon domain-containing protein n=1 Tax=Oscillochloris sp. ZM17-4 TaxID=2866714 RepID=UPI0021053404
MTTCPTCGAQNDPGNRFCDQCGTRIDAPADAAPDAGAAPPDQPTIAAPICPSCGAVVLPGEAFCDNCGADLVAMPAAASAAPVSADAPTMLAEAPTATPVTSSPAAGDVRCPSCGQTNLPGEAFCDNCGASLSAPVATPASDPAVSPVVSPDDATILAAP